MLRGFLFLERVIEFRIDCWVMIGFTFEVVERLFYLRFHCCRELLQLSRFILKKADFYRTALKFEGNESLRIHNVFI